MKVAFLMEGIDISSDNNVIFQHALFLAQNKISVSFLSRTKLTPEKYNWHPIFAQYQHLNIQWLTYNEASFIEFEIAVATFWATYYDLYHISAKSYVYFVQSIESRFYLDDQLEIKLFVEATYDLPIGVVTEATWIKNYLTKLRNLPVFLARNGIDKDIFTTKGECYQARENKKLRVLIEGPLESIFKNVPKTIQLCTLSEADEIWLLTSSDCTSYNGVDRVFSRVPIADTAKIYRSCDVIIKLSYVEGMFGPPLEAFHCGATAIIYDVTGHDEYVVHGYNGLIAKTYNEAEVIKYINQLKHNPQFLKQLQMNALETASKWINWSVSSKDFSNALIKAAESSMVTRQQLKIHSIRCNSFKNLVHHIINQEPYNTIYLHNKKLSDNIPEIHWAYRVAHLKGKLEKHPLLYKIVAKLLLFSNYIAKKFM